MLIHRMSANFGNLEGRTLELQEGLNIIQAPNEMGKSTWCAFLAAMLYGLNTRERGRGGSIPEKSRYLPWSGGTMLGRLDCRAGAEELTLLRTTRRSGAPMAEFRALYAGTGNVVEGLSGENCGETLLGVSREVFTRSAFIRQSDLALTQDAELEERIAALISSGDDGGAACTEALEALRRQLNLRRRNKTGRLPDLEAQLREVEEKRLAAEELARTAAACRSEVEALERRRAELESELERCRRWESLRRRQTVEQAQADADDAQQRLDALRTTLDADRIPSVETIARLRGAIVNLSGAAKNVDKARAQRDEAAKALLRAEAAVNESPFAGKSAEAAAREAQMPPKAKANLFPAISGSLALFALFAAAGYFLNNIPLIFGGAAVAVAVQLLWATHSRKKAQSTALQKRFGTTDRDAIAAQAAEYGRLCETLDAARAESERCSAAAESLHAALTANEQAILLDIRRFAPDAFDLSTADGLLRSCAQRRKELAEAEQAAREVKLRLDILRSGSGALPASLGGMKAPLRSRTAVEADLHILETELVQKRSEADRLEGRLHAAGDAAVLRAQAQRLQEQIDALEEEYEAIRLAMDTLQEADRELQGRFSPALGRRTGEIFRELTNGAYDTAAVDRQLHLSAQSAGDAQPRDIGYLSSGAADQLYLAARLAICEAVLPADKQVPLILDDALMSFDDARCAAALGWLKQAAQARQVILFSCHSREADFFAADPEVHVQRLTEAAQRV